MQTSGSAAIKKLIQLVKAALSGKMDKAGGTFTGNVSGKYFTGTWLQTTEATDLGRVPGKIAVLDESGWVYNVTDAFTTTAAFVEGTGHAYGAGTNVVCVDAGSGSYKWDVLAGTIDLTELTADEVQTLWDSI